MIACPKCENGLVDGKTCSACKGNAHIISLAEFREMIENPPHHEFAGDTAARYYYYGRQDQPYLDLTYALSRDGCTCKNDLLGLVELLEKWEAGNG